MTDRVGHCFADPSLRRRALTHRSAGARNNERLEFLGDGLVNLIVAEALFHRFPYADEGWLTRARAQLVREESLAGIARELLLGDQLELGPGELKSGGYRRDSILADALEAMIGAIHLDAGFETCRRTVLIWFEPRFASLAVSGTEKDAKTRLQEWLQARGLPLPEYVLLDTRGEEHDRMFDVACRLDTPAMEASGDGSSRRQAEQRAARAILERLPV
ncbi:ribonuclease III [Xanthomonadaceae bacterium XH05]|nr:ribonuclease III [Xanthomonadaceae bacterium XH05]